MGGGFVRTDVVIIPIPPLIFFLFRLAILLTRLLLPPHAFRFGGSRRLSTTNIHHAQSNIICINSGMWVGHLFVIIILLLSSSSIVPELKLVVFPFFLRERELLYYYFFCSSSSDGSSWSHAHRRRAPRFALPRVVWWWWWT